MILRDIIAVLEQLAPPALQEDYDNSGLLLGSPQQEVHSALVCIDVTEAVLQEAISLGANLIIAHHPLIFRGLKRLTAANYVERTLLSAIRHNIALYAIHTNLDNVPLGVNNKIAQLIGLQNTRILQPQRNGLRKLVYFVPHAHAQAVQQAVFAAGAGHIGNYDNCSYQISGHGSFRALEGANPFVGQTGTLHTEPEIRVETVLPQHLQRQVVKALLAAHPYEEVAYDLYPLDQVNPGIGAGLVGELPNEEDEMTFLQRLKSTFGANGLRYTPLLGRSIKRVAMCGGSGSFLLKAAIAAGADVFVSADFKYHEYFDAEGKIVIADLGHYESEQFTKELILEILSEKIPNFAAYKSAVNTSPVNYL